MQKPVPTYVALGDSTGVGVGAREGGYVDRLHRKLKFSDAAFLLDNRCINGATSDTVLRAQLARVAPRPTLITLGIGINDITHRTDPDAFSSNIASILQQVKNLEPAVFLVCNIPEVSSAPVVPPFVRDGVRVILDVFNKRMAEVCRNHQVTLIDAYTPSCEVIPKRPEFFSADGFHPSDMGYQYWADVMWPHVRDAVVPALRATRPPERTEQ